MPPGPRRRAPRRPARRLAIVTPSGRIESESNAPRGAGEPGLSWQPLCTLNGGTGRDRLQARADLDRVCGLGETTRSAAATGPTGSSAGGRRPDRRPWRRLRHRRLRAGNRQGDRGSERPRRRRLRDGSAVRRALSPGWSSRSSSAARPLPTARPAQSTGASPSNVRGSSAAPRSGRWTRTEPTSDGSARERPCLVPGRRAHPARRPGGSAGRRPSRRQRRASARGDRRADSCGASAWSPDGSSVAFGGPDGVYLVPAGGGAARRLVAAYEPAPAWSPDGRARVHRHRRGRQRDERRRLQSPYPPGREGGGRSARLLVAGRLDNRVRRRAKRHLDRARRRRAISAAHSGARRRPDRRPPGLRTGGGSRSSTTASTSAWSIPTAGASCG